MRTQLTPYSLLLPHMYTYCITPPIPSPLVFLIFFILYLSFNAIHVQYFGFDFSCWNILLSCLSPTTTWWLFFLLYLIFNIRFNFCITMLVYLNAVRPKHRPCLSLQRKIDMVFVPTNIVRSFFLLHFLNLLLFIHVHFYYSIFLITHYMYRT